MQICVHGVLEGAVVCVVGVLEAILLKVVGKPREAFELGSSENRAVSIEGKEAERGLQTHGSLPVPMEIR